MVESFQIEQVKSSFPFGSTVVYDHIVNTGEEDLKYQDYFYGLFNWATPTNVLKWRIMEQEEVVDTYSIIYIIQYTYFIVLPLSWLYVIVEKYSSMFLL